MSLLSIAVLYLSVNAFSCAGVAATIVNASVTKSTPDNKNSLDEFFMAATVVGLISAMQANSKKKNRCSLALRGVFHSARPGVDSRR